MESKKGRIIVNYCGGWGYYSRARFVKQAVEKKFPSSFEFDLQEDPDVTGRLEVTVFIGDESEGHLVHSKANGCSVEIATPLPAGSDFFATPSWKFFNV